MEISSRVAPTNPLENYDRSNGNENHPLLDFISPSSPILEQLQSQGYSVLPSILTTKECDDALHVLWDFVETSSGYVNREDPSTWYPTSPQQCHDDDDADADNNNLEEDPWPHTGIKSFSDVFQSNGAGWLLGDVRERLAERAFEPLYQTRELHCSKEGFTFHRPTAPENGYKPPSTWLQSLQQRFMATGQRQVVSVGEHFDQCNSSNGFHTIRSLVVLEHQVEGVDGGFLCYPGSHQSKAHQAITDKIYSGEKLSIPLTDQEIHQFLTTEFGCAPKRLYLAKGDVLLWRSDLVHAPISPSSHTPRFLAVSYCSMHPAALTTPKVWHEKMEAYKQRRTGDHRSHLESWCNHQSSKNAHHRHYYRTSPPLLTFRLAELYGLVPYTSDDQEATQTRAIIRGVRFLPTNLPTRPSVRPCEANLVMLNAEDNSKMAGQEKYLGGMPSPCGRYVFGVPGTAKRVLQVTVSTEAMDWIGPEFEGKYKWLRGLEIPPSVMNSKDYPDGCCIGLPCNARGVLKINPANNHVYSFGQHLLTDTGCDGWLYHGGNLAPNGWIYAIPANANRVLKINPTTDEVCYIGPTFVGPQKWFGGIMGSDNYIYGVPHNEDGVLRIDPETDEITVLMQEDGSPLPHGRWKWHGGLAVRNKIYGFPNNADNVLVIDCDKQRVYTLGDNTILRSGRHRIPQDGCYKYLGGAVTLDGKYAYLFPCDAEQVLRIDTITDELRLIGPLLLEGENKYQNGFAARDGCLYGIPQRAAGVLRIVPAALTGNSDQDDDHVDVMYCGDDLVGTKDKFEGGVLGLDDCIYCMPLRPRTCVKIVPAET